jgi:hypothetical protein
MPHTPTAPPGTRFFGRVDRFHCECPHCATIIVAHKDVTIGSQHSAFKRPRATQYNPITSVVYCPGCRRSFGVGLLLWPLSRGGPGRQIPSDHQPTRREMRQLAQYAYGLWGLEIKHQGDALNIAIDQECICPRTEGGWMPSCPVHGWDQFKAQQEELRAERAAQAEQEPLNPEEEDEG